MLTMKSRTKMQQENLYEFLTAGDAARLLSDQFGRKIYAKDLESFCNEWRTVGMFKGKDGKTHGRKVGILRKDEISSLSLKKILDARNVRQLDELGKESLIKGWYVAFRKEKVNEKGKLGWKPYLETYEGSEIDAPKNFTELTDAEYTVALSQKGRRLEAFEIPNFNTDGVVVLKDETRIEREIELIKKREKDIFQLELLRQEKDMKETILADYVTKARDGMERLNMMKFSDRNSETGKFEEYSLKRMLLKLYYINPSPAFILWNFPEVSKKVIEFFDIATLKNSEASQKLCIRALWHVLGIEKIVSEAALIKIEERREKAISKPTLRDEIKSALELCDPITQLELIENRTENEFIQSRISIYYDALETAAAEGNGLVAAEAIAREKCFGGLAARVEKVGAKKTFLKLK